MDSSHFHPTPYEDVNAALALLRDGVQLVLGARLVGLYLHGSLAGGDFNPRSSDIDFAVITEDAVDDSLIPALRAMHEGITQSGLKWAKKMEGSYISRQAIRRYDPVNASHPALRVDGSFEVDYNASDWIIQRWVLRERGIALVGPPINDLVDSVPPDDLRRAARGILLEWWEPMLLDTSLLQDDEYQAYAVMTMCRIGYTIHEGRVASKPTAARWAAEQSGQKWAGLIHQASIWQRGDAMNRLDDVLALIGDTVTRYK